MPELLRRLAALLASRRPGAEPRWPGRTALLSGGAALARLDELCAEALTCEEASGSPRAALAEAAGLAMAGLRATARVPGDALTDVHAGLEAAAGRCTPLLVRATLSDRPQHGGGPGLGGFPALADTGAFVLAPRDAQDALDLQLVARRVAELGLLPGVLLVEGRELSGSVRPLALPEEELVASFLGLADDEIDCPTPAQVLLFGDSRRRVPRWFDPDRPTAHGVMPRGADLAAALAGRRRFFADELAPLARSAMAELGELTGRPLDLVTRHRLEDARHVLVLHGAAVETAEAVADALRGEGLKAGVLGLRWLRPFPAEAIAEALPRAETITVLERSVDSLAGLPPLARELKASGAADGAELLSARFGIGGQPLRARDLAAAFRNAAGETRRRRYWLGLSSPTGEPDFPKRQALLQRLRRDHPGLDEDILPAAAEPLDLRPADARTVTLHAFRPAEPALAENLAAALAERSGPAIVVRHLPAAPDCLRLAAIASGESFRDPGDELATDLVLLLGDAAPVALDPLEHLAPGGRLVVATERPAVELAAALPEPWLDRLRDLDGRLFRVEAGLDALLAVLGEEATAEECVLPVPVRSHGEVELPLAVRRFRKVGETHDNVARFWGEVAQPRLDGRPGDAVPDPYLASGAVPSGTATFHDMSAERATLPLVDARHCTGCGDCWTACPDSSIAPTAVSVENLLRTALAGTDLPTEDAGRAQLQRSLPQLAARIEGRIAKQGEESFEPGLLKEAAEWLAGKLELGDDEHAAFASAVEAVAGASCRAPLAVTQPFFHAAKAAGGKPELLALAVNPQSCQGCGGCAEVCPHDAIEIARQDPEKVERLAAAWRDWEKLPDTPGATLARAGSEIGELPALLMSRHVFFAVAGGDGAEPGSGERLALRHATAVLEGRGQQDALRRGRELEELRGELETALAQTLAGSVDVTDLAAVGEALESEDGELQARLRESGAAGSVDEARARELVEAARRVEALREQALAGPTGLGRARFSLVVAGSQLADWAASFPRNPFSVPVALDLAGSGPELAGGLLRGLLERAADEERTRRGARLLLEAKAERTSAEEALRAAGWRELLADGAERPSLVLLGDPSSLLGEGAAGLARLLAGELPVKVLLLDDGTAGLSGVDPVLLALACRRAFVLSTSVAHPEHLRAGWNAALDFDGPALVRIHAPSPRREGFATERAVDQARRAVSSRVHPLLGYNPRGEGVFGLRLSLDGNPAPEDAWVAGPGERPFTPGDWALGLQRWAGSFGPASEAGTELHEWAALPAAQRRERRPVLTTAGGERLTVPDRIAALTVERAETWATLQEMAGLVTPFTGAVRARLETELAGERRASLEALQGEHARERAELEAGARARQAAALTDRLMRLAGYAEGEGPAS